MNPLEPWLWEAIVKLQVTCADHGRPLDGVRLTFAKEADPPGGIDFTAFSSVGALSVRTESAEQARRAKEHHEAVIMAAVDAALR